MDYKKLIGDIDDLLIAHPSENVSKMYLRKASDAIKQLIANGVTVQEWISVDDMLLEQGEKAICIDADGDMMIGKYTEWGWMFPCYFEELTHWMPIPEPPKGE